MFQNIPSNNTFVWKKNSNRDILTLQAYKMQAMYATESECNTKSRGMYETC